MKIECDKLFESHYCGGGCISRKLEGIFHHENLATRYDKEFHFAARYDLVLVLAGTIIVVNRLNVSGLNVVDILH